jgi:hypothetical protein
MLRLHHHALLQVQIKREKANLFHIARRIGPESCRTKKNACTRQALSY